MRPLKFVLMAHFIQQFLHVHEFMIMCYDTKSNLDSQFPNHVLVGKTYFYAKLTYLVIHPNNLLSITRFFFGKKINNWVKGKSTTWQFHFLMMQYNDLRWIKHLKMSQKINYNGSFEICLERSIKNIFESFLI